MDAKQDGTTPMPSCDAKYKQGWYECTRDANGTISPTGSASNVAKQFGKYAEFCFKEYGSKVTKWTTMNEAWTFTFLASGYGKAPSVQPYMDVNIWPYVAGHNVIFAHLAAVKAFRALQNSGTLTGAHEIGIVNNQDWREPIGDSAETLAKATKAANDMLESQLGWYCDPIYGVDGKHDYPASMYEAGHYMPTLSATEQKELEENRPDFFGLNHYGCVRAHGKLPRIAHRAADSTCLRGTRCLPRQRACRCIRPSSAG